MRCRRAWHSRHKAEDFMTPHAQATKKAGFPSWRAPRERPATRIRAALHHCRRQRQETMRSNWQAFWLPAQAMRHAFPRVTKPNASRCASRAVTDAPMAASYGSSTGYSGGSATDLHRFSYYPAMGTTSATSIDARRNFVNGRRQRRQIFFTSCVVAGDTCDNT